MTGKRLLAPLIALIVLWGAWQSFAEDPPAPASKASSCPAAWYQSTKCGEPSLYVEAADQCDCEPCTKDGNCACLKALAQGTGEIAGTLISKHLKRAPALVYLEDLGTHGFLPAPSRPLMDQKDKVFLPRVLPVLKGATVTFANSDSFDHNVFSPDGEKFDLGNFGKGKSAEYTFDKKGVYTILCKLHPEMIAYVIATETPFFTVVEGDGEAPFTLRHVPAGKWRIKVWHERFRGKALDYAVEVTVTEGKTVSAALKP